MRKLSNELNKRDKAVLSQEWTMLVYIHRKCKALNA